MPPEEQPPPTQTSEPEDAPPRTEEMDVVDPTMEAVHSDTIGEHCEFPRVKTLKPDDPEPTVGYSDADADHHSGDTHDIKQRQPPPPPPRTPDSPGLGVSRDAAIPTAPMPTALTERFEVMNTLGRGGMGVVYLCRDRRLEREVGIKLVLTQNRRMVERFELEGKALAALEHDNIVRIYDYGISDSIPFLVMEFVRGKTLLAVLNAGRPTVMEAVRLMIDVLKGMVFAHGKGIIHRDLKPANVFVDEEGRAKVADFGLARSAKPGTRSLDICGTPGYMAPEQARGEEGLPADVYSLGVMLHQMLTGAKLFPGKNAAETLRIQREVIPPPPSQGNPSVPPLIDELVQRCVAIAPEKRPTCPEMLKTLTAWLDKASRAGRNASSSGFPARPYKLLEHFHSDDAAIFFGRRAEEMELVEILARPQIRMLSIFGPCGVGKSSLLHAGLLTELRRHGWEILPLTSGPDPADALRQVIATVATQHGVTLPSGEAVTADALELTPDAMVSTLTKLSKVRAANHAIVIDQLEEVFTQNPRGTPRIAAFFDTVARVVESQVPSVKVVLSYRSEFHAQFLPLEERLARYKKSYLVQMMSESGLVEAIEGPTQIEFYAYSFEKGVAHRIARDILNSCEQSGDTPLPILQIICSQLFDRMKRQSSRTITLSMYLTLGGAQGALERYIENKLSGPEYGEGIGMARQMLKTLTVKEEGKERFSRARDEEEVLAFPDAAQARQTLERLTADHLVVRVANAEGRRQVRLASEVICKLVDTWQLEPDATERAYRTLTRYHRAWLDGGRRSSDFITGTALDLIAQHLGELQHVTADERLLVQLSLRHRRNQRLGIASAGTLAAALVFWMAYISFWRPGHVCLDSIPHGATVKLGTQVLGQTPVIWAVRPGLYRFSLSKDRYRESETVVQVSAGATGTATPVLSYAYGLMSVASAPLGAQVQVWRTGEKKAQLVGTWATPFTTEVLPATYSLTLTMAGYFTRGVPDVVVQENRELTARVIGLEPRLGKLMVRASMDGTNMVLRDEATGAKAWESVLPLKVPHTLTAGRYKMVCTRPGSETYTQSVEVRHQTTSTYTAWVPPVKVVWEYRADGPISASPTVADFDRDGILDVVVGSADHKIHAISGWTGTKMWATNLGRELTASATIGDFDKNGVPDVAIGSVDGNVYALDGRTGEKLWTYAAGSAADASATVADLNRDGVPDVIIGSREPHVHAISGATGKALWQFTSKAAVRRGTAVGDLDGDGVPDVAAAAQDGTVHAISGATGKEIWSYETGGWAQAPALADLDRDGVDDVVVGSGDARLHAISGKTGRGLWSFTTAGPIAAGAALADLNGDGVPDVVCGSTDQNVYALNGKSGALLWDYQTGGPIRATPALRDVDQDGIPDVAIGSTDRRVHVISGADGSTIWSYETGSWVHSPAMGDLIGDGVPDVIVTSQDGAVSVLSSRPGATAWAQDMGGDVPAPPLIVCLDGDDVLDAIVATESGQISALQGSSGLVMWTKATGSALAQPLATGRMSENGPHSVVATFADGSVLALSVEDGSERWTGAVGLEPSRPLLVDVDGDRLDDVVAGDSGGELNALSGKDGKQLWTVKLPGPIEEIAGGRIAKDRPWALMVSTKGGKLECRDSKTGAPVWSFAHRGRFTRATVGDLDGDGHAEVIIGSSDRRLRALDGVTGKLKWEVETRRPIGSTPVLVDLEGDGKKEVVVGSAYLDLQVHGADGRMLWLSDAGGPSATMPELVDVDGDKVLDVIIGSRDRNVHVLSGRNGAQLLKLSASAPLDYTPQILSRPDKERPYVELLVPATRRLLQRVRIRWPLRRVEPWWFTAHRNAPGAPTKSD
jgi:outer membrane protein assembly factor BamB/tRNA A-37 threonylcarbamoyl transferase component Bud32